MLADLLRSLAGLRLTDEDGEAHVLELRPLATDAEIRKLEDALPAPPILLTADRPMIIVTTPSLEGRRITKYLGLVSGEAILGANIFRDLFAGIRDIVGGRSAAYETELRKAKTIALEEMQDEAERLGGNAVVGVDLDYETITMGSGGGMLMVSASGTAVLLE